MEILVGLIVKYPVIGTVLAILSAIPVIAQIVVVITPSKSDDEWLAKITSNSVVAKVIEFLKAFAPWQKGANGLELSSKSVEK